MKKLKNYLQTNKAKAIFALLLLASLTTQIKTVFIRGAIYENKETGQKILLFGDLHFKHTDLSSGQRKQLISEIKNLSQHECLTLVEDVNSNKVKLNNEKYQSTINFLKEDSLKNYGVDIKNESPLVKLHEDLIDNNINVENIECRYFTLNAFAKDDAFYEKNITPRDLLTEHKENITNLETQAKQISEYKKNYSSEDFSFISEFFTSACPFVKENSKKYVSELEKLTRFITNKENENNPAINKTSLKTMYKKYRDINLSNSYNFINSKIIISLMKNYDKKLIILCSGFAHCGFLECFISEIGYEKIKEIGVEKIDQDESEKLDKVIKNPPKPISVSELFKDINIKKKEPKYNYNLQTPKEKILEKNNLENNKNSLNKTLGQDKLLESNSDRWKKDLMDGKIYIDPTSIKLSLLQFDKEMEDTKKAVKNKVNNL